MLVKWMSLAIISAICLQPLKADEFLFQPPAEVTLIPGMSRVFHPVSTKSREAQLYFNQGLTSVYAFNHDLAFWSFQKAAQIDPNLAMAYWGMALAVGGNINIPISSERSKSAYENIQKAITLSANATDNEKGYIQALAVRYSSDPKPDQKKLDLAYKNAMQKLVQNYPDDLDAASIYAESVLNLNPWHQWDAEGKPVGETLEGISILETVLKKDPDHLGANHYYIHIVEASKNPERALMSAHRLRTLLPASGHILHMPGHIYILVGDYHLAAQCNKEAIAADLAYIKHFGMAGVYPLHYLSHNYYFLNRAECLEGRYEDALKSAAELEKFYSPHHEKMTDLEYYAIAPLLTYLRFNKWEEILKLPPYPAAMPVANALLHYGKSVSYASLGQFDKAAQEQAQFLELKKQLAQDSRFGYNAAKNILNIGEQMILAKLAFAQGKLPEAISYLKQAVKLQDNLNYNEPPDWYHSIRESLGAVLIASGNYSEAEKVFREDLEKHPRNGRSLFGLAESLRLQNRQTDFQWVDHQLKEAWKHSTTPLQLSALF